MIQARRNSPETENANDLLGMLLSQSDADNFTLEECIEEAVMFYYVCEPLSILLIPFFDTVFDQSLGIYRLG